MNKRIEELAEQAAEYCKTQPREIAGTIWEEKFAELIVRECRVALSPMLRDMVSRGQAYDLIKKHFGVEQ